VDLLLKMRHDFFSVVWLTIRPKFAIVFFGTYIFKVSCIESHEMHNLSPTPLYLVGALLYVIYSIFKSLTGEYQLVSLHMKIKVSNIKMTYTYITL
jgi:hypothetical protein